MIDRPADDTARVLQAAVPAGDLDALERVFADDVRWLGSRGGGCYAREEVLEFLRSQFDSPTPPRLTTVRAVGAGIVIEAELYSSDDGGTSARWTAALVVDDDGRIKRIQDYENVATAEEDLTALPTAPTARAVDATRVPGAVAGLVPFVNVADVVRSMAFYALLGLRTRDTYEPRGRPVWAFLDSGTAALMVAETDAPINPHGQDVLLYLYSPDLAGLRAHLLASGVLAGEILDGSPGPRQEMQLSDPDGYRLAIAQIDDESAGG
ncbi:MAG: nuclear transport factor 2 family protein [Acidimicrobiales bacterium]